MQRDNIYKIRSEILICLFITIFILIVYLQVKDHDFINFDDDQYIINNSHVNTGLKFKNIIWAFTHSYAANWHPLTWISHMIDVELYGMDAGRHHITNVLFHILNSLLLFVIFKNMTGKLWESAFIAVLFAVHPLHVESVAWASERKDVLSTFFLMLTIWSYIYYTKKPTTIKYLTFFLFYVFGLLSKPMIITLPFVLLLLDYWPLGRISNIRLIILEKVPLFIFSAASIIITLFAQGKGGAIWSFDLIPLNSRIANALISYSTYLWKTVYPFNLVIFYPYPTVFPLYKVLFSVIFLLFISFFAIQRAKTYPWFIAGWVWYVVTLLPVIGIIQIGSQAMADRYTYIPLIGIFIILAFGISELIKRWKHKMLIYSLLSIAIISALMIMTWIQIGFWHNSITLFEHALANTSNNFVAHNNLGVALEKIQSRKHEAITHYKKAISINHNYADAHNNIGSLMEQQGNLKEAYSHLKKVLLFSPKNAAAHNNIGNVLKQYGNFKGALYHYKEALHINPDFAEAHNNIGRMFAENGNFKEALYHFNEVLRLKPDFAKTYANIGNILDKQGSYEDAIYYYKQALRLDPQCADAYYNMGNIFFRHGNVEEAFNNFKKAISANPVYVEAHNNLGIILAQQGKIQDAIKNFQEANRIRPNYMDAKRNLDKAMSLLYKK